MPLGQPFHFTLPLSVRPSVRPVVRGWAEWEPPSEGTEWTRLWGHRLEGAERWGRARRTSGRGWLGAGWAAVTGGGERGPVTWEDQGEQSHIQENLRMTKKQGSHHRGGEVGECGETENKGSWADCAGPALRRHWKTVLEMNG